MEAEQAANHCGMGNLNLVVQVMLDWLNEKTQTAAEKEHATVELA